MRAGPMWRRAPSGSRPTRGPCTSLFELSVPSYCEEGQDTGAIGSAAFVAVLLDFTVNLLLPWVAGVLSARKRGRRCELPERAFPAVCNRLARHGM
jgi:hypothetical protein